MYELHPVYGAFLQLYRLTAMLREIVEEANKIIQLVRSEGGSKDVGVKFDPPAK